MERRYRKLERNIPKSLRQLLRGFRGGGDFARGQYSPQIASAEWAASRNRKHDMAETHALRVCAGSHGKAPELQIAAPAR